MELTELVRISRVPQAFMLAPDGTVSSEGFLSISSHHFIFTSPAVEIEMLLSNMEERDVRTMPQKGSIISIRCRDLRRVTFLIPNDEHAGALVQTIDALSIPAQPRWLFCFFFKSRDAITNGWSMYPPEEELARMGLPSDKWRLSEFNKTYQYSPSSPAKIIVPASVDDDALIDAAKYRLGGRFPTPCYIHAKNGIPMLRGGQPLVGTFQKRSHSDVQIFRETLAACGAEKGVLLDLRSQVEAEQDKTRGGGYEIEEYYFKWKRVFAGFDSLSNLSDSFFKFVNAVIDPEGNLPTEDASWLRYVQCSLSSALVVANQIHRSNTPVIVLCATGRDLSLVVTTIAQVLIDPYYRTTHGFLALIERDWLQGGHAFSVRHAHFGPRTPRERAPVFALFLDCVWQLVRQFPMYFEFTSALLELLFDHSQSSCYGTFYFSCQQERAASNVASDAPSLWGHLADPTVKKTFANPCYVPVPDWLRPVVRSQFLMPWVSLYARWTPLRDAHEEVCKGMAQMAAKRDALRIEVDQAEARLAAL